MDDELRHRDVPLRGVRLSYAEAGEGPALLLIHGFLVSHKEWRPILPLLTPHFRCILPDLPGFGASEKPTDGRFPYTREAFAETLGDLLDHLEIDRAHVCGHSMGGAIALTLAADHPRRLERLSLVDSASFPFPLSLKARLPTLPVLGSFVFKKLYRRPVFRDYFENDVFSGHGGVDLERVDEYYDDFSSAEGREAAYATLQRAVMDLSSLGPKVPRVRAESLVLWGDEDRIFPVSLAHRLVNELPSATLHVLQRCGHAPNEERPEETAEALLAHHRPESG